jgi:excisionase family DNA binding protein
MMARNDGVRSYSLSLYLPPAHMQTTRAIGAMRNSMLFDKLLTTREVAAILRLNVGTILSAIHTGRLRASRFGRTYRVRPDDVEILINRHTSR